MFNHSDHSLIYICSQPDTLLNPMAQHRTYIRVFYATAAVLILSGIVVCSVWFWRSSKTNNALDATIRPEHIQAIEPPEVEADQASPSVLASSHLIAPTETVSQHKEEPEHTPLPSVSTTPQATLAAKATEDRHIPIPELSQHLIEATIAFFNKAGAGLEITNTEQGKVIAQKQTDRQTIHLMNITLADIPDQILPGIQFTRVHMFGSASSCSTAFSPPEEVERLAKVLHILSTVSIETLCITRFNTNEALPDPPRIAFPTISTLCIAYISPPFLEWLCKAVDLSGCTNPVSILLTDCSITSIRCLDNLGIQKLRGFELEDLQSLKVLDCHLLTKISPTSLGVLKLWRLSNPTEVSTDLATLLVEKRWNDVWMDMRIWNGICSYTKKSMGVVSELWLNVRDLWELDPDKVWIAGTTLGVQENVPNKPTYTAFFGSVLKWLMGGGEKTETLKSVRVRPTDWVWTSKNEHKVQCLAKMVSESEEWSAMLKQKTLYINSIQVPIPEHIPEHTPKP
ncbi:hypothetical protein NEDG_01568 [Nematocida displodere]|uniref:Uncharacterized protein n=1 Tax=Nematocida displodere TaxID=1805483 RepID=A0A177EGR0_9MICR|nr:hypothetical protein NEDG_01568 [Nematocida displodere]